MQVYITSPSIKGARMCNRTAHLIHKECGREMKRKNHLIFLPKFFLGGASVEFSGI